MQIGSWKLFGVGVGGSRLVSWRDRKEKTFFPRVVVACASWGCMRGRGKVWPVGLKLRFLNTVWPAELMGIW